jgi:hypothetical protein
MGLDTETTKDQREKVVDLFEKDLSKWIDVKLKTVKNVDYGNGD